MTDLWIPVTVAAALVQCLRTVFQRQLLFHVPSTTFVNFARYAFCAPAALLAMTVWFGFYPSELKPPPASFYGWCALAGVLQILGTWALLAALSHGNFAVAVTLSKTEAIQAALLSILVLGEYVRPMGWLAICACLAGVVVVSPAFRLRIAGVASGWQPAGVFYGLLAGFFFGLTGIGIRAATFSLGAIQSLSSSLMILAATATIQVGIFGVYLCYSQFAELVRFFRVFLRPAFLIGMTSALASFGYFIAMGLQQVAYVFALGQVEIIFSIAASRVIFKQSLILRELLGIALIVGGIVMMLMLSTRE